MILLIIISSILLSAIFSGLEIAFITADKMQMEIINKRGGTIAKILSSFTKSPSRFIATLLIGNNLALVVFGTEMEQLLQPQLQLYTDNTILILLIQTAVSTFLILIFAEYLPKTIFRLKPNHTLRFFAFPMYALFWLLKWVVNVTVSFSKIILRRFMGVDLQEDKPIFGRMELQQYLSARTDNPENESNVDAEVQYYKNVLDFQSVKVRDCMVPRTETVALDVNTDIVTLSRVFKDTGHSKILIYKNTIDDVIGFVHTRELFKKPKTLRTILRPVGFIPESMTAQRALNNFIALRKSLLVVVDEFGGTAGMITVEDVLEEIIGEIEDEHDKLTYVEEQLTDLEYLFSGRLEVDYINEKFGMKIPTDESYETLAGYLYSHTEKIPEEGETVVIDDFTFLIEEVSETRIEVVKLVLSNPVST